MNTTTTCPACGRSMHPVAITASGRIARGGEPFDRLTLPLHRRHAGGRRRCDASGFGLEAAAAAFAARVAK